MKKSLKIIIGIFVLLGIVLLGAYYALTPSESVNTSKGRIITSEELLIGSFIDNVEILKNPLRAQGKISISKDDFKDVVYTAMTEYNIEELKNIDVNIFNNVIKVVSPYKVLGFIDSQISVNLNPTIVNHNLNIKLTDCKLGKIKIKDEKIGGLLKQYKDKIPFTLKDNVVIVNKNDTYPLTLNKIDVKDKEILLDLQLEVNNLIDFISKYKVNIIG
ncbi:hypothetical protein QOZ84_09525 [Romboutsia sedimentorum]|uniref:DUF2140 family protein n=1 Tax=Romboutsia sedimentorum TaxID=1368474 RepID=A0ABT7EA34_9FIRM|nr:hypothetical protein [Romboutsia sedimentorum]MDK2563788.1 hypothetical protein [Romboutsia sedimentorum]